MEPCAFQRSRQGCRHRLPVHGHSLGDCIGPERAKVSSELRGGTPSQDGGMFLTQGAVLPSQVPLWPVMSTE